MKQLRCKCVACRGKTVRFSRQRLVKNMAWYLGQGLVTQAHADEAIRKFDAYHKEQL